MSIFFKYKNNELKKSLAHANWLKNNLNQFNLEVIQKFGPNENRHIDSNIRIIIFSQKFDYQMISYMNLVKDLELYEFSFFENGKYLYLNNINNKIHENNHINENIIIKNNY